MTSWLVVLAVGAGSYVMRVAPLLFSDRLEASARFDNLIRHAGSAALTALIVTSTVRAGNSFAWLPILASVAAGLAVAARHGSMLRVVGIGLAVYVLCGVDVSMFG